MADKLWTSELQFWASEGIDWTLKGQTWTSEVRIWASEGIDWTSKGQTWTSEHQFRASEVQTRCLEQKIWSLSLQNWSKHSQKGSFEGY
jgi:hypothetical protein